MVNAFDQFDELEKKKKANAFDQFDPQPAQPVDKSNAVSRNLQRVADKAFQISEQRIVPDLAPNTKQADISDLADAIPRFGAQLVGGTAQLGAGLASEPLKTTGNLAKALIDIPREAGEKIPQGLAELLIQGKPIEGAKNLGIGGFRALETAALVAPTGKLAKAPTKAAPKSTTTQFLEDSAETGIEPTLAARHPRTAGGISKVAADNPLTAGAIEGQAAKLTGQAEDATAKIARAFGDNQNVNQTGRAVIDASERFANKRTGTTGPGSTFRDRSDRLFDVATRRVDMDAAASVQATTKTVADIKSTIKNPTLAAAEKNPKIDLTEDILRDISNNPLTIAEMRRHRSSVRRAQDANRFERAVDDAELSRLEGALTEDIYASIKANGGERALVAAKRADAFYAKGKQTIGNALKPFLQKGQSEEGAFRAVIAAAKQSKDGGNIERIRTLRRSLKPDELQEVSSGVVANLGKPRGGGDFSVQTFANEFRTLNPEAKQLLFGHNKAALANLETLARRLKPQAVVESLTNRSRSGAVASSAAAIGLSSVNLIAGIASIAGTAGMGRLMLSPTFTKAVLKASEETSSAAGAGARIATDAERAKMVAILSTVEASNDAAADVAREVLERLQSEAPANLAASR